MRFSRKDSLDESATVVVAKNFRELYDRTTPVVPVKDENCPPPPPRFPIHFNSNFPRPDRCTQVRLTKTHGLLRHIGSYAHTFHLRAHTVQLDAGRDCVNIISIFQC